MKKILLLIVWMLFFSSVFAFSNENFEIKSDGFMWTAGKISLTLKKLKDMNMMPNTLKLKIGGMQMNIVKSDFQDWTFVFSFPMKQDITELNNKIVITYNEKWSKWPEKTMVLPIRYTTFKYINLTNLTGWKEVEIWWYLTWTCSLILSNNQKLWVSIRWNYGYAKIPNHFDTNIVGWYLDCNDLNSNWLNFNIYKSPKLLYLISQDKKRIKPGSTVFLYWNNFKLKDNDNVQLLINWKKYLGKVYVMNSNQIKFTLPNQNLLNAKLQVLRNWFTSNELSFSSITYPEITKVNPVVDTKKSYFRILWKFDYSLWWLSVSYAWKNLTVLDTGLDYIDVEYPKITKTNDDFSCSYYIQPWYFQVNIWNIKSNKYFYYDTDLPRITEIKQPICGNWKCKIQFYITQANKKFKVFLNGTEIKSDTFGNLITIYTDGLIKKWTIQLIFENCVESPIYNFDYTQEYTPEITYITSDNDFNPWHNFHINWNYLDSDGTNTDMWLKISLSPNYLKKLYWLRWTLTDTATIWTKVDVSLSNKNWTSNWWSFVVWWKNTYYWNPLIQNVLYLKGWEWGEEATIKWVWFSDKCSEDQIIFGGQTLYPKDCDYSYLTFVIPSDRTTDSLQVVVQDNKSNIYKLRSSLWWTIVDHKSIWFISNNISKLVNFAKDSLSQKIDFYIKNTKYPIYISRLTFKLKTNQALPADNFILSINWNDKKVSFSPDQNKLTDSSNQNIWYIQKVDDGYEIIFNGLYIPFSLDNIKLELSFDLFKNTEDNSLLSVLIPKQQVYYYNVFDAKRVNSLSIDNPINLANLRIVNKKPICYDTSSTYANCALVLQWWEVSFHNEKVSTTKQTNNIQKQETKQNIQTESKAQNKKVLTKQEKIANRLDKQKMELVNNVLKNFLIKMHQKYKFDKNKLKYLVEMYRWYKIMLKNTLDNYQNKIEYVNWLIYFAKNYFAFIKVK